METKGMLESESSRTADLEKILASKAVDGNRDRAALARAEEELARARRETDKAEKALAKMKTAATSAAATGTATVDPELREERDKLYVGLWTSALPSFSMRLADSNSHVIAVDPSLLDLLLAPPVALHHQVHAQSVHLYTSFPQGRRGLTTPILMRLAFCKECIDNRISTRQRKCPACNLAFAVSDVSQVRRYTSQFAGVIGADYVDSLRSCPLHFQVYFQ